MKPLDQPKWDRWLHVLILGGLLLALFLNLGINAVYLEEPRRCMVGLEMQYRGNYIVPTYYGEFYYRKPPIFNWALLGSFKIWGVTEFGARFVTVLSLLLWGGVNYVFTRKYASETLARYSSLLLMCSTIILFFMGMFAEIDIFYCLISYSGIIVYYHFYRQDRPYLMFIGLYGISTIGLLTKGLPSLPFIGMTILGFLAWKRNWRQVFSLAHVVGFLLFAGLMAGYLYWYSQYNSLEGYWGGVWGEASGRTMIRQSWLRLVRHVIEFPLATLLDIAPAGLFSLFLLRKGAWKRLFSNDLMAFCGVIWMANFLVYWSSPGAKGVYVMMLDPFLVILCVQLWLNESPTLPWTGKLLGGFNIFCLSFITLAVIAVPFIDFFAPIEGLWWQSAIFLAGMAGVWWLWTKSRGNRLAWLVMALIAGRIAFNVVVLPMREWDGRHTRFKNDSERIVELTEGEQLWIWQPKDEGHFAHHFAFYIERGRKEVLRWTEEKNCDDFYMTFERDVDPNKVEVFHRFKNWDHDYVLFKFRDCGVSG